MSAVKMVENLTSSQRKSKVGLEPSKKIPESRMQNSIRKG